MTFVLGLAWAGYTNHAWEDYYITYRASKNLATGHGLTFTAGERVHSFTSPLGTLLPAVASILTGNRSDITALWIFRVMSLTALSGAAIVLWRFGEAVSGRRFFCVALVGLLLTDAKILDFSTNGMETALLLLFLAWTLYALLAAPPRPVLQLGLAWAGLMWSRPDSFIYIALLSLGALLFGPFNGSLTRAKLLKTYLLAGLVTTACYLPWLGWAKLYYGSPIPHTIVAKGMGMPALNPARVLQSLGEVPAKIREGSISSIAATFLPAYGSGAHSGWPMFVQMLALILAIGLCFVWLFPFFRREARVTSFAFLGGHYYLTCVMGFPYPWYIPAVTVLGFVTFAGIADQLANARPWLRSGAWAGMGLFVAGAAALAGGVAYQMRIQQQFIEGQRRDIGLWLRAYASSPRDTVFLEPLGYIGFYSNLKMFDYPGLSSPEVVAAIKKARTEQPTRNNRELWSTVIRILQPDWIVLRPFERSVVESTDADLLHTDYEQAKIFDVSPHLRAIAVLPGRDYLLYDQIFEIYHRRTTHAAQTDSRATEDMPVHLKNLTRSQAFAPIGEDGARLSAHAPAVMTHPLPTGATTVSGGFGMAPEVYTDPARATDGAEFIVELIDARGTRFELFRRLLDPVHVAADRGTQQFSVTLPAGANGSIDFTISPGPHQSNVFDWTYWEGLHFGVATLSK
ncbi:MAG TPA: hypothetical protein VFJ90_12635 [Candidatus Didemnitutus sp.]|nr:hypothetical protein [Candidatus Didemnitutus sp.]